MKLNITCPINSLSYGLVSQNILDNLSCNYTLRQIGNISTEDYYKYLHQIKSFFHLDINAPSFKIFHEHSIFDHVGKGPRIAFPIFEKNRFNDFERFNLKYQDLVVVCSEWAKSIVEPINPNVLVAPLGVDTDFKPGYAPLNKIIFYTQGKREVRKGHDYLHKVFHKAFSNVDDVELWMFTQNVFDTPQETQSFQQEYKSLLGNKVKFFPRLDKQEMISWLSKTHCGIFLSRAEGWNMPLHEAMAMGKEVIATYYSGHTEFLPKESGIMPIKLVEASDGKWFNGGFEWMEIEANEEEIVQRLRQMREYLYKGIPYNQNNVVAANNFTWKNTTRRIEDAIFRM